MVKALKIFLDDTHVSPFWRDNKLIPLLKEVGFTLITPRHTHEREEADFELFVVDPRISTAG